jgi:hypothetical protein
MNEIQNSFANAIQLDHLTEKQIDTLLEMLKDK